MTKKILDLSGLQRYDTKLKDYVAEEVNKCGLDPIPSADVESLFEGETPTGPTFNITTTSSRYDVDAEDFIDIPTVTLTFTQANWPDTLIDNVNNRTYTKNGSETIQYRNDIDNYDYSLMDFDSSREYPFVSTDELPQDGREYELTID